MRLLDAISSLATLEANDSISNDSELYQWKQRCYYAMNDDFNTPILIAQLFEGVKIINLLKDQKRAISPSDLELLGNTMNTFFFDVLGLFDEQQSNTKQLDQLKGLVELLIKERNKARAQRDFARYDEIRDAIIALGIQLKDTKDGTTFSLS